MSGHWVVTNYFLTTRYRNIIHTMSSQLNSNKTKRLDRQKNCDYTIHTNMILRSLIFDDGYNNVNLMTKDTLKSSKPSLYIHNEFLLPSVLLCSIT